MRSILILIGAIVVGYFLFRGFQAWRQEQKEQKQMAEKAKVLLEKQEVASGDKQ